MQRLLWIVGGTLGGAAGWWIGGKFGGVMTAYTVSIIGTLAGVYGGIRFARNLLD